MRAEALMDVGCYPISLSRWLFSAEPAQVIGVMQVDPRFGTDSQTSAMLDFDGRTATFACSTQMTPYQRVQILGSRGRIEIEIPFNAPADRPCRLWLEREGRTEEIQFPICNQYTIQADLFAESGLDGKPVPTPLADGVANMRMIDRIVTGARERAWQACG